MQTFGHHHAHKEHVKQIIEEENLETPAESVEFLQYVKKHQKKVEHHKRRMHSFHKALFAVGVGALGYMLLRHYAHSQQMHHGAEEDHAASHHQHGGHDDHSGRHHKLGASAETAETNAYGQTFSAVSVAMWGLVVAKAKAGMEASTKSDSQTVGGIVSKVGTICALIAAAALCQFMGSVGAPEVAKTSAATSHKLQASQEASHPDSFYDKESSHYMGGAHNALLQYAKDTMDTREVEEPTNAHQILNNYARNAMEDTTSAKIPSAEEMGGSHNVAMALLAEQSNSYMRKQKEEEKRQMSPFSLLAPPRAASRQEIQANIVGTGRFMAFLATVAICIASFITVKTYHAHLEKQDELLALLKNPNARVAAGKKGKQIAKKMALKAEAARLDEETPVEDKISELIKAAKQAKAKKVIEEAQSELLLNGYQAPKLQAAHPAPQQTVSYQLVEPVQQFVAQPAPKVQAPQPQPVNGYWYPQNFEVQAPLPVPQIQTQATPLVSKVAIQQPEPMREPLPKQPNLADLPKKDLIKALLLQLAKEGGDLESQQ